MNKKFKIVIKMIKDRDLKKLNKRSLEDKHTILEYLIEEALCPVYVKKYCKINGIKNEKTIYNRIKAGKLKHIEIDGHKLVYLIQ